MGVNAFILIAPLSHVLLTSMFRAFGDVEMSPRAMYGYGSKNVIYSGTKFKERKKIQSSFRKHAVYTYVRT